MPADHGERTASRRRGRRPAGTDTRADILDAARRLFCEHGYDAVSLRAIAREAGVDPSLVHHYFEGKPAVFVASMLTPDALPTQRLAPAHACPPEEQGRALVRVLLELWDDPAQAGALRAVLAAAASGEQAVRPYREFLLREVIGTLGTPGAQDPRRQQLVASQLIGLVVARRLVGLPAVRDASAEELSDWVGPTLQRYLDMPLEQS